MPSDAGQTRRLSLGTHICIAIVFVPQLAALNDITGINTIVVDEDLPAVLHCLHTTNVLVSVKWFRDGQLVPQSEAFFIHKNGSLVIRRAKLSDSGVYECQSEPTNSTGTPVTSKVANLSIRERLRFVSLPSNKNLELNSNSKLICKARGAPPLTVKWVKWSKEGVLSLDWPAHIQDLNGTLYLNQVKREDAGNYTCVATNSQGIINASIEVLTTIKPRFTIEPKDSSVSEGSSVHLHCRAEGEPIPSIQWDKNNALNDFDPQRFVVLSNGTLAIESVFVEDAGKYGCTAGNMGGFIRSEMTLTVTDEYNSNQLGSNSEENTDKMKRTVAITLTAATLYMVLVMALMVYCRYRRAKRKASESLRSQANKPGGDHMEMKDRTNGTDNPEQHRLLASADGKSKIVKNALRSEGDVHSQASSTHSSRRSKSPFEKWQICRQDLQKICLLGHGEFGEVFLAKNNKLPENGQIVLVKALHSKDENIIIDFKREIEMFSKTTHNRIVRLVGFCTEVEPFLFVLEYSDWGDLKQFLLATRDDQSRKGPKPTPLTLAQMIGICHQIATAMDYLTNNRFVHKDLATRNCLISSKLDIKITSTSLSKDTYSNEYFNYRNRDVPIRWAPHEAIIEDEWSAKSDIFSFGVTVWEIFFRAELPYADKTDPMVIRSLQAHELRLPVTEHMPNLLKELLSSCWNVSPKDRPTFADVCHVLNKILCNVNNF